MRRSNPGCKASQPVSGSSGGGGGVAGGGGGEGVAAGVGVGGRGVCPLHPISSSSVRRIPQAYRETKQ